LRRLTRIRQIAEFWRIFQDPVLFIGLVLVVIFVVVAILAPIYKMVEESRTAKGQELFDRYLNSPVYRHIIENTLKMGLIVGATGTALGFLMAYVQVKMRVPLKRFMHFMCLIPVISPPFAVATAILLLFGRSGLISKRMFGVRYDIYGLDGLTIVLTLSLFTLAYLNLKGMMLALDPALDEAATNLGAGKWRIFRTVTLPMLLPGIAGSFLIIFVEAVADLGNPLVLGGNYEVLATRIYVSIVGLYNTTAAAVLSVILLIPSLVVFAVQRYWVSRLSVISASRRRSITRWCAGRCSRWR
jgi:iron(III) transport system permease protein